MKNINERKRNKFANQKNETEMSDDSMNDPLS